LENYYRVNFQLLQNFHYSLHEIEDMMPWEREIYLIMLIDDIKEKNEKANQQGYR
jgi:hypothetical protein